MTVNLRDRYIREQINRHEDSIFMTYEQWLEDLCKKLMQQSEEYHEVLKLYAHYVLKK
jgi:uncharacterized short protein YbdD (DUF466 family)